MASSLFFNGRQYTTPAAPTQVNDDAMAPASPTVGNVLAIIGNAADGQPLTVYSFGDPTEVDAILADGDLRYAVKKAFNASNDEDVNAPNLVLAVRVGTSTPATVTLKDASGNNAIVLTSASYGVLANLAKVQVQAGTNAGKLLSVYKNGAGFTGDNTGRGAFTIQYAGTGASATMTVANTTVTLSQPAGTQVASIDLTVYQTVAQLVDAINAVAGFSAAVVSGSENTPALNGLDSVSNQDVKTSLYTARADLQACIDWFNQANGLVTATRAMGAGAPPANIGWTFLAGGTDPAVMTADWVNALNLLQTVDCQHVVVLSGDPAIHAAASAHVQYMSNVAEKPRRAYVGPVAGTAMAAVEALPLALDDDRTELCWPGYWDYNAAGVLTLFPSYMTAALVAAGFAGANPGTPMTNKTLTVRGLEYTPRNPTDTDALIQAGVTCLESTSEGFKVVRSVSTWLANNNYNRVEVSAGIAVDYMVASVQAVLLPFRGKKADPYMLGRAISAVDTVLRALSVPEPTGPAILVGDANSPPYRNLTGAISGDTMSITWEASPVLPINFIPQTVSIQPYSGTATATSAAT